MDPKKSIKRPHAVFFFFSQGYPFPFYTTISSNMSIKFNDSPSSILTPSTIQCTRFYTSAAASLRPMAAFSHTKKRYSSMHEMKKYLVKETGGGGNGKGGILKSQSMPIIKSRPPLKLLQRSITTSACLDAMLATNVRMSKILIHDKTKCHAWFDTYSHHIIIV